MRLIVTPATERQAESIGRNLRAADNLEVLTSSGGKEPAVVLRDSFRASKECYAIKIAHEGGMPCAIFGVADDPTVEGLGVIWMLCTKAIERCPIALVKVALGWIDHMARHYPLGLHNIADARNDLHIRWAKLSGFTEVGAVELNGHRFIHIYRESKHV